LGGVFTDQITWRWAFYINLPIGVIALFMIIFKLKLPQYGKKVTYTLWDIDYLGTTSVTGAIVCLLLALNWAGNTYDWDSGIIVGLLVASGGLTIVFLMVEWKVAAQPIIPMYLFRHGNFSLVMIISFIVGWVMMGVFAFLPLFFQTVYGLSATNSGIQIFPLAIAMPVFSIISGILISKTGKYRIYAPLGTLILGIGFYLLHIIPEKYNVGIVTGYLIVLGIGIGLVMQTLVLIAQGAVPAKDIAVATTTVTFIRSLGSVFGTSIFGTLINNLVSNKLGFTVSSAGAGGNLHALPQPVLDAFYYAYTTIFLYAVPVTALAFIFTPFIKNIALRTTLGSRGPATPRVDKKKNSAILKWQRLKKLKSKVKSLNRCMILLLTINLDFQMLLKYYPMK